MPKRSKAGRPSRLETFAGHVDVYLPADALGYIERTADATGAPMSLIARRLITDAIAARKKGGKV